MRLCPWLRPFLIVLRLLEISSLLFHGFHYRRPHRMVQLCHPGAAQQQDISIRNFCIIAHVDHGKSTLADRLLELTNSVEKREMKEQLLDNMDIERERGITIKLQTARMKYRSKNGNEYTLNLIDTPGHVDFGYEVSRSLAACEGAVLLVDACQGVEAQTVANTLLAMENGLKILPVINKIDAPTANVDRVMSDIERTLGFCRKDVLLCSAKTGQGVEAILESIVDKLPSPRKEQVNCLRALVFDSFYDSFRGVVVTFRVMDGVIRLGDRIRLMNSTFSGEVLELGVSTPKKVPVVELHAGEVGYLAAGIRSVEHARVGDTITHQVLPPVLLSLPSSQSSNCTQLNDLEPLPGYAPAKAMVYAGFYPSNSDDFEDLREALEKLRLNDASFSFTPESSTAMGHGFRCGFLGLLHMDIIQERLEREFNLDVVATAPSVLYKVLLKNKLREKSPAKDSEPANQDYGSSEAVDDVDVAWINTPSKLPAGGTYSAIQEPYVRLEVTTPPEYMGKLMETCQSRRGDYIEVKYVSENRSTLVYEMPMAEVISDLFDNIKSKSRGYATMTFFDVGYRTNRLVRLDIRINGDEVPPFTTIVPEERAHDIGKEICEQLKELIPRQQFKVPIQACVGNKPVASASISATYKDVLAKCYGGDVTRKKKLLEKQARGKKRMRAVGKVNVPQEAFMSIIRRKGSGGNSGN